VLPAPLYLLHHMSTRASSASASARSSASMRPPCCFAPRCVLIQNAPGRLQDAVIGFGGGLVGGLTAMPGALPTIWCELRGMPKDQQRGFVQPYITAMQLFALALMVSHDRPSSQALLQLTVSLPALAAGAMLGVAMFRRVDNVRFRHIVLAVAARSQG